MHDFQGKTLVLTGANGGIGREVAKLFYANGANIVLTDLDEAGLLAFADTLDGGVGRVAALRMDAANPEDAEKAVVAATTRFGGIDFLVPSVGLGHLRSLAIGWYR